LTIAARAPTTKAAAVTVRTILLLRKCFCVRVMNGC